MAPRTPSPMLMASNAQGVSETHSPMRVGVDRWSKPISQAFPPIDDHIVIPEVSPIQLIDGREVIDVGSLDPHADAQALTSFLLAAHVLATYIVATELLTRVAENSDFATDVSIRKRGIDPETNQRYLEELSFEIVNTQSNSNVTAKARNLSRRGVRRVFAIFITTGEIREWSRSEGAFFPLDPNGMFDDPVFVRPIAIKALVDSTLATAETEVAKALIAKRNPEIVKLRADAERDGHAKGLDEGHKKGLDEGHKKGLDEGQRALLKRLLLRRFGDLPGSLEARIDVANAKQLERWTDEIFSASCIENVFVGDA